MTSEDSDAVAASNAAATAETSSYVEAASMEEDTGADYLNLNEPVGSFAEYSPPRQHPRRASPSKQHPGEEGQRPLRSPAASYPFGGYPHPPHHHSAPQYYPKSPRSAAAAGHGPPPPHHYPGMYPYPPPPHHSHSKGRRGEHPSSAPPPHHYPYPPPGAMGYAHRYYPPYPQHPADPWTSPQAYETEAYDTGDKEEGESNIKEAFRASPPQGSPHRPSDEVDTDTTPEKIVKMRSPFRSPPMSQTKKSPMFRSPALGGYGSFGMMDTPGGTLAAEFSPMGPMGLLANPFAASFGEHPTPPQLSLSRSESDDGVDMPDATSDNATGEIDPALAAMASPFSGFMDKHFPHSAKKNLQGVSRSPLRSERRGASTSDPRADRPPMQHLTSTEPPNSTRRPTAQPTTLLASPVGHSSSAKPRKLWHGPSEPPPGPMRLELGSNSSMKKSLDGINSMMRNQNAPPPATPGSRLYSHPPPPSANYRRLINTPIKLDPSPMHSKAMGPPSTGNKRSMASSVKSVRDGKIARSGGKENTTTPAPKRSPCNCKKSKCLKLYCECFAAELFCEGCNCTDCQNIDAFASIRDKAMKDTRAKNPNAFKPRISVKGLQGAIALGTQSGHNMGCKCKRSECLKKYCECFQAGVMCGGKCKCSDCMNFAGSQKLIDKRRKIKDQRGAELAMKVAEQAWKGPQHSARKLPVARPAVHGMRPMPSPVATPGGRLPMAMHMMHPSPSHPYMRPMLMGPPHGHMGYSPMGMHPHVSPSAYGMYPPPVHHHHMPTPPHHHHMPPPPPTPMASATKRANSKSTIDSMEMPYTRTVSAKQSSPMRLGTIGSPGAAVRFDVSPEAHSVKVQTAANEDTETSPMSVKDKASPSVESPPAALDEPKTDETGDASETSDNDSSAPPATTSDPPVHPSPKDAARPDSTSIQPTPVVEKNESGAAEITPMPATPAPAVRLAYDPSTEKKRSNNNTVDEDAVVEEDKKALRSQ